MQERHCQGITQLSYDTGYSPAVVPGVGVKRKRSVPHEWNTSFWIITLPGFPPADMPVISLVLGGGLEPPQAFRPNRF